MPSKKVRKITVHSGATTLVKLDQRTKEAQLMRQVRADLTAHVGGRPSYAQRILIHQAAVLTLRCSQIEAMILEGAVLTQHDNSHALAWANSLRRCVTALGLDGAASGKPSLDDHLAMLAGRNAA
jgi:hypothetical protein